jgi:O-succinylbenzoic acid--CoA ligase
MFPPVDPLRERSGATPQRLALSDTADGTEWTYRALDAAVDEMAAALQSATDAESRDPEERPPRLAVALSTRPAFVFAVHATLRLGWQLAPLNTRLAAEELDTRIGRLDPELILCGRDTEDGVAEALGSGTAADVELLTVDEPRTRTSRALPDPDRPVGPDPHAPDDTALILFTSGTTGEPKGVRLTPGNLVSSAVSSAFRLGVSPGDRWLCCLPMYHMGGLAPTVRSALYGTTLLVQREFDADATAAVLAEEGITGVSLVPTQLSRLLDAGVEAPDLRTILLGGAPAPETLLDRAAEAGLPVYPTYGLTETASQVATALPQDVKNHPGTVGQPLFGTTVRLVDGGEPVERGREGEIVVDGPTVTPGYLEAGRDSFSEFGFHTGDLGRRDEDGRLWVLGRLDDTIITGGELVAPAEVAARLRRVPGIESAAVVGLEDEEWGERVSALLVAGPDAPDHETLRERVLAHCRDALADYKHPKTVGFADAIPRTHSGTIDRERVRALLAENR